MSRYRQTFSDLLNEVRLVEQMKTIKLRNGAKVLDKVFSNRTQADNAAKSLMTQHKGVEADAYQSPFNNRFYVRIKEETIKEQDAQDHEVSMARGELEAIADKATQLASMLQGKSDDGNPLEAWVQSKITKAKDYINSVSDYMTYNPDMKQNEETILEKSFTSQQIKQAYGILNDPRYKGGNYDGAVKAIEKLAKGLSNHPDVKNALKRANEEVDLEEKFTVQITKKDGTTMELGRYNTPAEAQRFADMYGKGAKVKKEEVEFELDEDKIKDIFTANQEGESIDNIAKRLKMSAKDVRKILGEEIGEISEENLDEFTSDMIKRLKKSYSTMPQRLSTDQANALSRHLDRLDLVSLKQLAKEKIPFISTIARNKIYKKTGKFEEINEATPNMKDDPSDKPVSDKDTSKEKELKIKLDKEKDTDALEKQLVAAQGQINTLRTKLENEKNRAVKPEPNPETGEVPLTVGIAHKYIKDKKEKEVKKESVDNYPTSDIAKHKKDVATDPKMGEKKPVHLGAKMTYESIQGLKNKADKTGMPYSILKKVYDRGMAAWRGGHRPGASQQQWAFARVNSFVTKSSGTWGGADKDLAAKVKGSKK